MLPATPNFMRTALNRVTFGARDVDVQSALQLGWAGWVETQLAAPAGDDPELASHLASQQMRIAYPASDPANTRGTWTAVDEMRPLNYLTAPSATLWNLGRNAGTSLPGAERTRISQELAAATWIRNTHSRYQLREFMVDFWHNHFNIGKNENQIATAMLPVYDREAIRPHAFGNFRQMLEANAMSASMLIYLDNWVSTANTPNENYAREIMELHTLGGTAYLGTANAATVAKDASGVAVGFTDQDIVQASRALSGWTLRNGQRVSGVTQPSTGEFIFNPGQHNLNAGNLLGVSIAGLPGQTQGQRLIEIIANHPATATFVCTKLAKRIFGDAPPQAVIDRAVTAWRANASAPNQIAQVLRAALVAGPEVTQGPAAKVRRPYERIIAMFRTTDMVANATTQMTSILDSLNDYLFAWPAPDGRPDRNAYWLSTGANLRTWNLLQQLPTFTDIRTSLSAQAPLADAQSATAIVDYWVGRMVGYQLPSAAMNALVTDQAGSAGVPAAARGTNATRIEQAHRRLVSLIATSEAFSYR